ncbi:MAG: histidine kinase [Caulobacter sp.]|nr:histidine kinase [Caulobacter sp.]
MEHRFSDSPPILTTGRVAELIVEHARDYAIFALDRDGRITSWGKGAERILGYSAEEALGLDFAVLFTDSDRSTGQPRTEVERAWREGRAEDTRWHLRKNGERFWANGVTTAFRDGAAEGLIKVVRDETPSRMADERRILLLNELNHRINNTLVTVQSLVEQTLRASDVDGSVRENLTSRLMALSEAHKVLVQQNWAGADLLAIIERALAPYQQAGARRFATDGAQVRLSPQQAVSMSLILHELATNAVKYGALSTPAGSVEISWNLHLDALGGRHLTFLWAERDGPPVVAPVRRGFGSRLIARSFGEDAGHADVAYAAEGVRCTIHLMLSAAEEALMMEVGSNGEPSPA